jgi:hypothetical protein
LLRDFHKLLNYRLFWASALWFEGPTGAPETTTG